MPTATLFEIADAGLKTEKNTVREHNKKNKEVIHNSVEETGFLRSIVLDEDNNVLCGKGVTEEAETRGAKVLIIDVDDPNTVVAVRRSGLTEIQKSRAMLWDNHASDTSRDKNDEIRRIAIENPKQRILDGIFDDREQARIMKVHSDAQPLAAGGKEDDSEFERPEVQRQSTIRMVQIFTDAEQQPALIKNIKALGKLFNSKNVTDAVISIVERAHTEWLTESVDESNPATEAVA